VTAGAGSFRRRRTSGVATPIATAPQASVRNARELRKAARAYATVATASEELSSMRPGISSSGGGSSIPSSPIRRLRVV
jgi:hypothetical protein